MNKVIYKDFSNVKRVIAISDIHGDVEAFEGVIDQIQFSDDDVLIILGDMIEKGKQSLQLLRKIMQFVQIHQNVYVLKGNNDELLLECLSEAITDENILNYLQYVNESILKNMADELHLSYQTIKDVHLLRDKIKETYVDEITFIGELPIILDSNLATFVHAGIDPDISLQEQNEEYCLCAMAFGNCEKRFEKPVVVGHWPSSNYRCDVIDPSIYYHEKANIYSIDGGNSMKPWMQVNILIFENGKVSFDAYDSLPKVEALTDQKANSDAITLLFPNTALNIVEKDETQSRCFISFLNKEIMIENERIYTYKGQTYCSDFTTVDLEVKKHELLSVCKESCLYKKNGIVGQYHGKVKKSLDANS